jgi:hypothetical protein
MEIKNINGLSAANLQEAVNGGARFIYFPWTISVIFLTFRRTSGVYLIRRNETRFPKTFTYILVSFLFGWWGIPWGPKYTIQSIKTNLKGGKDVTDEVMAVVAGYSLFKEAAVKKG